MVGFAFRVGITIIHALYAREVFRCLIFAKGMAKEMEKVGGSQIRPIYDGKIIAIAVAGDFGRAPGCDLVRSEKKTKQLSEWHWN